jgi:hypothetical protein
LKLRYPRLYPPRQSIAIYCTILFKFYPSYKQNRPAHGFTFRTMSSSLSTALSTLSSTSPTNIPFGSDQSSNTSSILYSFLIIFLTLFAFAVVGAVLWHHVATRRMRRLNEAEAPWDMVETKGKKTWKKPKFWDVWADVGSVHENTLLAKWEYLLVSWLRLHTLNYSLTPYHSHWRFGNVHQMFRIHLSRFPMRGKYNNTVQLSAANLMALLQILTHPPRLMCRWQC